MMICDRLKLNPVLLKGVAVGAIGGLLFGFDTAVIAGTTRGLARAFHLSPQALGLTVSVALWGTVAGLAWRRVRRPVARQQASPARHGPSLRRLGHRLRACLELACPDGLSLYWRSGHRRLVCARSCLYDGACSCKVERQAGGLFQINVVLGVLLAYLSNFLIASIDSGPSQMAICTWIACVPALTFFFLLLNIPESARWLIAQNRRAEALAVLQSMGTRNSASEVGQIYASLGAEKMQSSERLFQRKYAFPIFLAVSMGAFNQLSGINAILYYLNDIFAAGGYGGVSSGLQAVAVGLMNLIATAVAITVIDKVGRKKLLLVGSIGMVVSLSSIAAVMSHKMPQHLLFPVADRIYLLICNVSRCRYLGVYQRGLSNPRAIEGAKPGHIGALDYECLHRGCVSNDSG